jgi:hypothetical protein
MSRVHCAVFALFAAACATTPPSKPASRAQVERSNVLALGDSFASSMGDLKVIAVQDDFQVVRCTDSGVIAGCFDTIFTVSIDQVRFNRWIPVPSTPGLEVALVTPTKVAFQIHPAAGDATR